MPKNYYCNLDANGMRRDRLQRAELLYGSIDFVAPPDYSTRPPQAPLFLFVVDASISSIASQLFETVLASISSMVECLEQQERVRVGIITYHSSVQVYTFQVCPHSQD